MADQHDRDLEDLLADVDNILDAPPPNEEEASVSSNHSTATSKDDDPTVPDPTQPDLGDTFEEEQTERPPTEADLEEAFKAAVITALKGGSNTSPPPKGPKMGEVITAGGRPLIRMGGVPDAAWTKLVRKSKVHPNQFRSIDPTKHYKVGLGLTPLDPVWTKSTKLSVLQDHVHKMLVHSGMEQHEYLPDPHKPTRMVNAILQPHLFARDLEATTATIKAQSKHYDGYDQGNDQLAHDFLLKCLDQDLNDKVGGLDHTDDLFLVTWIKVVRAWNIMT